MSTLTEEVRAGRSLPNRMSAKAIRVAAGVSQERLAQEIGVSRGSVARWESGLRHPRRDIKARYAQVLIALQEALSA